MTVVPSPDLILQGQIRVRQDVVGSLDCADAHSMADRQGVEGVARKDLAGNFGYC